MKLRHIIFLLVVIVLCSGRPNPQIGVNFLGYHAEAGLGGLLGGRGGAGGLFASAGTPYGQNAGAGGAGFFGNGLGGFLGAFANSG